MKKVKFWHIFKIAICSKQASNAAKANVKKKCFRSKHLHWPWFHI